MMKTLLPANKARALTWIEVLIIVAVVGVLAALFWPALVRSNARRSRIGCISYLRQTSLSFRVWAGDNGDKFPMQVSVTNGGTMELVQSGIVFRHFQVMSNELNTPKILFCPNESDRTRNMATTFDTRIAARARDQVLFASDKNTTYYVGVDADATVPAALLVGDRNLTLNGVPITPGLVTLAKGDALGWTSEMHVRKGNIGLADGSVLTCNGTFISTSTNRLAIP